MSFKDIFKNDALKEQTNYMVTVLLAWFITSGAGVLAGTTEWYIAAFFFTLWCIAIIIRKIDRDQEVFRLKHVIEQQVYQAKQMGQIAHEEHERQKRGNLTEAPMVGR